MPTENSSIGGHSWDSSSESDDSVRSAPYSRRKQIPSPPMRGSYTPRAGDLIRRQLHELRKAKQDLVDSRNAMQDRLVKERNEAVRKAELRREADLRKLERKLGKIKLSEEEKETEYREVGRKIMASESPSREAETYCSTYISREVAEVSEEEIDAQPPLHNIPPLRLGTLPPLKRIQPQYTLAAESNSNIDTLSSDGVEVEEESNRKPFEDVGDDASSTSSLSEEEERVAAEDVDEDRHCVNNSNETWECHFDNDAGQWYEYCAQTGESRWCSTETEVELVNEQVDSEKFDVWEVCMDEGGMSFTTTKRQEFRSGRILVR